MHLRKIHIPLLLLTLPAFASPVMPARKDVPPPPAIRPNVPIPAHVAPAAVPDPAGPMTLERMKTFTISNPYRQAMLNEINARHAVISEAQSSSSAAKRLRPVHATTLSEGFGTTTNLTNDHITDTEPTVTAMFKGATLNTTVVGTRFPDGTHAHLYSYHSTSLPTFDGPHDLPLPTGYTQEGDPYLSGNGYTTGVWPGRLYCVGALFSDNTGSAASSIAVWHSDDAGQTWSNPAIVATANGGGHDLDKPNIVVSDFGGSAGVASTRGYVYVTWIDENVNTPSGSSVNVAMSTDGGSTFTSPTIVSFENVQFPQVVVNPNDGTVYEIWANLDYGDLLMAQSGPDLTTFGAEDIVSGLYIMTMDTIITGNVRVNSIPAARFDWPSNRLVVVYTGVASSGPASGATDIYYTFKGGCTNCNAYGWQQPVQVASNTTNDQFMPAIDFNQAGDVIVTYYDRRDDSANTNYREYVTVMASDGSSRSYESQVIGAPVSNPNGRSIGDYQDVWVDNYPDGQSASFPWIGFPTTLVNDLYFSRFFFQ